MNVSDENRDMNNEVSGADANVTDTICYTRRGRADKKPLRLNYDV